MDAIKQARSGRGARVREGKPALTKEALARPVASSGGGSGESVLRVGLSNALAQLERDAEERAGLWSRRVAQIAGVVSEADGSCATPELSPENIAARLAIAIESAIESASREIRAMLPESAAPSMEESAESECVTIAGGDEGALVGRMEALLNGSLVRARAARGAALLGQGAVAALRVRPGTISAEVAGSRSRPWLSEVRVSPLAKSALARATKHLERAQELGGSGREREVRAAAEAVFPASVAELRLACECPDPGACKHSVALLLAVARLGESHPRALLRWRGVTVPEGLSRE